MHYRTIAFLAHTRLTCFFLSKEVLKSRSGMLRILVGMRGELFCLIGDLLELVAIVAKKLAFEYMLGVVKRSKL